MTRRRILCILSPERPGADTAIHLLALRMLDRSRFELHVAYRRGSQTERELASIPDLRRRPTEFGPGPATGSLPSRLGRYAAFLRTGLSLLGLAWYARRARIAVVYGSDRSRDAATSVLVAKIAGARSVLHLHVAMGAWMSGATRWAIAHADTVVAISAFVARSLDRVHVPAARRRVVLNAIDARSWRYARDGAAARVDLGLGPDDRVIACVGRLFRWKGQDELVRALPLVAQRVPGVRLVIVGADDRGAHGGGSFSEELRALASSLGVSDRLLLTGPLPDVEGVLAACDVFALPSYEEPFGLVFIEAMAMRRPVVALSSGGAPEVVEDGGSGYLCPPRDVAALADRLATLLLDPALRRAMGKRGRELVETRFAPGRLAADLGRILEEPLNRNSTST